MMIFGIQTFAFEKKNHFTYGGFEDSKDSAINHPSHKMQASN